MQNPVLRRNTILDADLQSNGCRVAWVARDVSFLARARHVGSYNQAILAALNMRAFSRIWQSDHGYTRGEGHIPSY